MTISGTNYITGQDRNEPNYVSGSLCRVCLRRAQKRREAVPERDRKTKWV
jgi:hypothetical protein